jgi:site-specific DNA recombinase
MQKGQENGAVVYVRVSTDEQANGPLNLGNQEKRCREYCKQHGWSVLEVFIDPGESARSVERPEFKRMLAYCRTHRRKVQYVVVQDLSRFAHNLQDQAQTISELERIGVLLRSTYESNIDETAAGKLAANIFGTFNQYFSGALSEKMRDRTRQSVSAGRFPWRVPIGYRNVGGKDGPNIVPDETRAPLIRRAFELVASGLHKQSAVLQIVTDEGLTTAGGRPLPKQTFQAVLRNPLYAGFVTLPSDPNFEPVKGLHEPIVSQETFDRVQAILHGRRPSIVPKRKVNPLLPLKCFVRCESCSTPLTGGLARGRNKKYPRYWWVSSSRC